LLLNRKNIVKEVFYVYQRMSLFLLTFMFMVFIVTACGNQDNGNVNQESEEVSSQENEANDDQNEEKQQKVDITASEDHDETVVNKSNASNDEDKPLPKDIEIYDEVQTDEGVIFELEKITFENDYIEVHFNAENLSGYRVLFARAGAAKGDNLGGITLQDNTGFDYRYVADEEARLEVEDQEKIDAIVRFVGSIQEDAQTLTLKFNPEENMDMNPKFTYEDIELEW